RLVEHHQYVGRYAGQEVLQRINSEPGTRRVVRIGNEQNAGIVIDGLDQAVKVVAIVDGRDHATFRAHRLSTDRVGGEGMGTEHGIQAGRQIGARNDVDNVVGAVAQGDQLRGQAKT